MNNVLRIIPEREKPTWVQLLFQEGQHAGHNVPDYPLTFPLPAKLRKNVVGSFLYVVYRSEVVGYGKIDKVEPHVGNAVGEEKHPVPPGDNLTLDGPLQRMPFSLACRSFRRFRYTDVDLHAVSKEAAEAELERLGLALQ